MNIYILMSVAVAVSLWIVGAGTTFSALSSIQCGRGFTHFRAHPLQK